MELDNVTPKQLTEIERLARELAVVLRKSGLQEEAVTKAVQQLELDASNVRRTRYDAQNPEYSGY